ncbi:unnamed protein product [Closterium sp. NIES-53]
MTPNPDNPVPRAQQFAEILQEARTRAADAIKKANVITKRNADCHLRPVTYQPDDLVLLNTLNLRLPITPKLRPRYCGLFRISHMIIPVTAHLLLPAVWYVSPSFHVSLLRPYIPSTSQLARTRPASMTRPPTEPVITPEKILSHRVRDPQGARRRSTGDPRLILEKGYRHVGLGGYGRTDQLLNKPFYPNGLVVGILTGGRGGWLRYIVFTQAFAHRILCLDSAILIRSFNCTRNTRR